MQPGRSNLQCVLKIQGANVSFYARRKATKHGGSPTEDYVLVHGHAIVNVHALHHQTECSIKVAMHSATLQPDQTRSVCQLIDHTSLHHGLATNDAI